MDDDAAPPLTLSREDLYQLVWSKPMSELAEDFGISDVALAKRCRRLGIPTPGRGYWARIAAGHPPYHPRLPERQEQPLDREVLSVPLPAAEDDEIARKGANQDQIWLTDQASFEKQPENSIVVEQPPARWHPVVRIHRDKLRSEAKEARASKAAYERFEKLSEARKQRQWNSHGWKWDQMLRSGQRLCDYHRAQPFRVTLDTFERALAIANAIALSGIQRVFELRNDEKEGRLALVGHGSEVEFRITEQLETTLRPSEWRAGELRKHKTPTGRLRLTLSQGWREAPTLEDRSSSPLETQLSRFFAGVYKLVVRQWRQDRETRVRQERERVEAHRRAEEARVSARKERRAAHERRRQALLKVEARRWEEARRIRAYAAWVQESSWDAPRKTVDRSASWVTWALRVADALDPTTLRVRRIARK